MSSFSYQETSYSSGGSLGGAQLVGSSQLVGQTLSSASGNRAGFSSSSGSAGTVNQIAQDLLQFNQSGRASGASLNAGSSSFNAGSASYNSGAAATSINAGSSSFNAGSASFNAGGASSSNSGAAAALIINAGSSSLIAGSVPLNAAGAASSISGASTALIAGGASFSSSSSFNASSSQSGSGVYLSEIEQAILRSTVPVEVSESENLTVSFKGQQETGIWANRQEVINWRGLIPISEYVINEDLNPEVITKRTEQQLVYIQELAIRYLRPPTPPAPGDILIKQELNTQTPPAPPLVIRQVAARADTPEPLVIREAPPAPPASVGRKVITISGKRIPPPPRKVVIERLAPLPSKPQSVLVERWLPYSQTKRRVIFQRSDKVDAIVVKPRNVIVQWEAPQVVIKKEFKYLGVIRANPVEYVQRYGASLKVSRDLPDFVLDIKTPEGLVLAADYKYNSVHDLEGDVKALGFVDLESEGLSEYKSFLANLGISFVGAANVSSAASQFQSSVASASFSASSGASSSSILVSSASAGNSSAAAGFSLSGNASSSSSTALSNSASAAAQSVTLETVKAIFKSIDREGNGRVSVDEASRVILELNSRLGRSYGADQVRSFFKALDKDNSGELSLEEITIAFQNINFTL